MTRPLIVFLTVLVLYLPSLKNDFIYDDFEVVLVQKSRPSLGEMAQLFLEPHFPSLPYYRPITRTTLIFQKTVHGENPVPFHLFNAILMAVGALLAFTLLRLPVFKVRTLWAVMAALLSGLHPVASTCVYPVASGRETLLPGVLILGTMNAFLRKGRGWYALSIILFCMALFAKEQAFVVPALLVLADGLGLSERSGDRSRLQWIRRYLPVALICAAYLFIRYQLFKGTELSLGNLTEVPLAYLYALQVIFLPFMQVVYEPPLSVWFALPRFGLTVLLILFTGYWMTRCWTTLKKSFFFWLGWFLITLLPTANILRQEAHFAERYVFLASLSVFGILAGLISQAKEKSRVYRAGIGAAIVIAGFLGTVSFTRARFYKSEKAFQWQWLQTNPRSVNALYCYGNEMAKQRNYDAAIHYLSDAFRLEDYNEKVAFNLGFAHYKKGNFIEAAKYFQKVIELKPGIAKAHFRLAQCLEKQNVFESAVRHFAEALRLDSLEADYHNGFGIAMARQGKLDLALDHFKRSLALKPDNPNAHYNIGNIHRLRGELDSAIIRYEAALASSPGWPLAQKELERVLSLKKRD